jgi:hypothetical protein
MPCLFNINVDAHFCFAFFLSFQIKGEGKIRENGMMKANLEPEGPQSRFFDKKRKEKKKNVNKDDLREIKSTHLIPFDEFLAILKRF